MKCCRGIFDAQVISLVSKEPPNIDGDWHGMRIVWKSHNNCVEFLELGSHNLWGNSGRHCATPKTSDICLVLITVFRSWDHICNMRYIGSVASYRFAESLRRGIVFYRIPCPRRLIQGVRWLSCYTNSCGLSELTSSLSLVLGDVDLFCRHWGYCLGVTSLKVFSNRPKKIATISTKIGQMASR